jgi:hypothetical protein
MRGVLSGGSRRAAVAVVASAFLAAASALAPVVPAGATHAKVVVATGTISCSKVSGSITFHPAEHHVGTRPERIAVVFHTSHCVTTGSNVKSVTGGSLSEVITRPTNECASSLAIFSHPVHATGTWTAKRMRLHSTTGTFSGFAFTFATNGDVGVVIPNEGGTAHITGSFAGTNHGASSTAAGFINLTALEVRAACKSPQGLPLLRITSGRVTF